MAPPAKRRRVDDPATRTAYYPLTDLEITDDEFWMRIIVITGAASGLGRAFLDHYITQERTTIYCIDRDPIDVKSVGQGYTGRTEKLGEHVNILRCTPIDERKSTGVFSLNIIQMDMALHLRETLSHLGDGPLRHIDMVIHCAGIRGLTPHETTDPQSIIEAEGHANMDFGTMMKTFEINTAVTFSLLQGCIPWLQRAALQKRKPRVIIMGSRMGSIAGNTTGGAYAYRASKAALNAMVRSFSIDFPKVLWLTMHPGRVETGLTKGREENAFETQEVMPDMLKQIADLRPETSGRFIDRFGKEIPW